MAKGQKVETQVSFMCKAKEQAILLQAQDQDYCLHLNNSRLMAPGLPSLLAVPGDGSNVLSDPLYTDMKILSSARADKRESCVENCSVILPSTIFMHLRKILPVTSSRLSFVSPEV